MSAPTRPRTSHGPRVGSQDARQQLQRRRLAGAVRADDAERFPARDLERDVAERPEFRSCNSSAGRARVTLLTIAGIESRRLSWRSPVRNFFETLSKTTTELLTSAFSQDGHGPERIIGRGVKNQYSSL